MHAITAISLLEQWKLRAAGERAAMGGSAGSDVQAPKLYLDSIRRETGMGQSSYLASKGEKKRKVERSQLWKLL